MVSAQLKDYAKFLMHYLPFGTSKLFFGQVHYGHLLYKILLFSHPC